MNLTSRNKYGNFTKWLLHTRLGAYIGFKSGVSGYNRLDVVVKDSEGRIKRKGHSYNARVNVGAALTGSLLTGTTFGGLSSPLPFKYIALSTSTLSPASTDTTLSGETSATGLARAAGTIGGYTAPTALDGAASYTITNTFANNSGSTKTLLSAGLFDAASTGNMFAESNFGFAATLPNPGDQIVVTWTINI